MIQKYKTKESKIPARLLNNSNIFYNLMELVKKLNLIIRLELELMLFIIISVKLYLRINLSLWVHKQIIVVNMLLS